MKKVCVIGWPVSHSRSPLIHNYWLKHYGIDGHYEALPVAPGNLPDFFARLRAGEYVGCNITIPHKETAASFVDRLLPEARISGSVNTVFRDQDLLVGDSSDGAGFADNVTAAVEGFQWVDKTVLLLGAGGSARAIIAGLVRRRVKTVQVWNRTPERARQLAQVFGEVVTAISWDSIVEAARRSDIIVNTTSTGLAGTPPLDFPFERLPTAKIVADIVYVPLMTPFLAAASKAGHATVPGLGMLLHQAAPGFERWFGHRPEVTRELFDLVARDIEQGARR